MIKIPRPRASGAPADDDTRSRILDAAERLFAARGIEAVSVRSILAEAGVNVALAHYHFGGRDGLISELLRARVAPLIRELLRELDAVDARGAAASVEDVLRAYYAPAARWLTDRPAFGRIFAQLQTSPSPEVRALGHDALRGVLRRLGEALVPRLPAPVEPKRFFLQFQLIIAGPSFLSGNWEEIRASARRHLGSAEMDAEWIADELVTFTAAALRGRPVQGRDDDTVEGRRGARDERRR